MLAGAGDTLAKPLEHLLQDTIILTFHPSGSFAVLAVISHLSLFADIRQSFQQ
jgi:hypothetical protein